MDRVKFNEFFQRFVEQAVIIQDVLKGSGILILLEGEMDWMRLKKITGEHLVAVAATNQLFLTGAKDFDFKPVYISQIDGASIYDRMTSAFLESVANDIFVPGSRIIVLYNGFDSAIIDSMSIINIGEHLDQLSGKELRKIDTKVPLKTLKRVVDLALDIGREGREGKAVGTLFVVGDTKNVLHNSKMAGFDPVRGYKCKERSLFDPRVREGIKEVAQLDGAFVVSLDGTVVAACRLLDTSTAKITLSKGLGARHWAAAAVSRATNAVAIVVSQSSGTVRIFINGETVLRIESRGRIPLVWKEQSYVSPIQPQN